ncbi:hypothetical protein V6N13_133692 [Hibiscus sabdariffa]|uniref:Uncharacterized protein n=1 Tax=Hibiscus sabdariffa TaxID=183260 RepID=A0ABR2R0I9_9ROSI
MEKRCLHEQAQLAEKSGLELEDAKAFTEEVEMLNQRGNLERNELVGTIALMKKEAAESLEEFQRMKHLKDEKEAEAESLQSELNTLETQCTELRESMFKEGVEKQKLRKQVVKLEDDLKKEDGITGMEKKLKESNEITTVSDGTKTTLENDISPLLSCRPTEVASLREKLMWLEGQINLKEIALETSVNGFLEMEKDLHTKIDELESRVEQLDVHNTSFCKCQLQKAYKDSMDTSNDFISVPSVLSTVDSLSEKSDRTKDIYC